VPIFGVRGANSGIDDADNLAWKLAFVAEGKGASLLPASEDRMERYAGIDVSLDTASVCIVYGTGKALREAKIVSEPDALVAWFRELDFVLKRIGMEAGPLSQGLQAGMREKGSR
jgi:2-polyprenyl-6-methoxyphenol hydroxylase-like FAD-dependent oxidoreductase